MIEILIQCIYGAGFLLGLVVVVGIGGFIFDRLGRILGVPGRLRQCETDIRDLTLQVSLLSERLNPVKYHYHEPPIVDT